jgi:hypothetical protein
MAVRVHLEDRFRLISVIHTEWLQSIPQLDTVLYAPEKSRICDQIIRFDEEDRMLSEKSIRELHGTV